MNESSYWLEAVSEAMEAEGINATDKQMTAMASWMKTAHELHSNYSAPVDYSPGKKPAKQPEQTQEWWRDRNELSGNDWVLANRIHDLINSRYG